MAEQRVQYVIELLRQGQGAQQAADDLDKVDKSAAKLSATAGQLRSAFALLAGSVVTRELFQFARESIAAFEAQEKAIQKLDGTLRASGQFTREYSEHLQRLSERFQDVTNVADDVVLGVEAQLIAFGAAGHEIERLTGLVLDLSAGLGTDLNAAALLVGKALQGEFSSLSRYGILLNETASRSEKLEDALRQIEERFGGVAKATAEQRGGFAALGVTMGDFKEEVGGLITTVLEPAIRDATALIKQITGVLKALREEQRDLIPQSSLEMLSVLINPGGFVGSKMAMRRRGAADVAGGAAAGGVPETELDPSRLLDPVLAKREREALEHRLEIERLRSKMFSLPTDSGILFAGPGDRTILEAQRSARESQLINQLERGIIDDAAFAQFTEQIAREHHKAITQLQVQDFAVAQETVAGHAALSKNFTDLIAREFRTRELAIIDFYDKEIALAGENKLRIEQLEAEKTEVVQMNRDLWKQAEADAGRESEQFVVHQITLYQELLLPAVHQFSASFSATIVNAFRTGKLSLKEFVAEFTAQVAQMIFQMLILRAVMGFLGSIRGGAPAGTKVATNPFTGEASSFAPGASLLARGGVRFAADGILGVVDQPTYFPAFNVLAGEAGREVMAVLAHPQRASLDGLPGIMGDIGSSRAMLMEVPKIAAPRMAAEGMVSSPLDRLPGAPAAPMTGGVRGAALIRVTFERGLRAEIVDESIEGAVLRVENDLSQDTPISSSVKGLTA